MNISRRGTSVKASPSTPFHSFMSKRRIGSYGPSSIITNLINGPNETPTPFPLSMNSLIDSRSNLMNQQNYSQNSTFAGGITTSESKKATNGKKHSK